MRAMALLLSQDLIVHHLAQAIGDLCAGAESLRLIGTALENDAGELLASSPPEDLRQVAVVVKAHALSALLRATELANKAERLEAIADLCDAQDSPG